MPSIFDCIKGGKSIDPACGSGSMLLKAKKVLGRHAIRNGFFGQKRLNPKFCVNSK